METIRNYLESMFANLPNTAEVQKAKYELLQMMEDKYNELLSEGKAPNEAVGIVISEFGNLDELACTLGIQGVVNNQPPFQGRMLTMQEAKDFAKAKERSSLWISIGVLLCILSPVAFILAGAVTEGMNIPERIPFAVATAAFFIMIGAAVGLFIANGVRMEKWSFIRRQHVAIDYATAEYLYNRREEGRTTYAVMKTLGVLFCVFSFVPVAVMGALGEADTVMMIGSAILFLMVGIGVVLLISASGKENACMELLRKNNPNSVGGNYVPAQQEDLYKNETVAKIMEVYNPTILCIYLCWSFLTFDWHITWIIWPIAAIVRYWIRAVWGVKPEGGNFA